jgi:hypothetical protein
MDLEKLIVKNRHLSGYAPRVPSAASYRPEGVVASGAPIRGAV